MHRWAWAMLLLAVPLLLGLRWLSRWRCPSCHRRRGTVVDDLWDRQWRLRCRACGHTWEERC